MEMMNRDETVAYLLGKDSGTYDFADLRDHPLLRSGKREGECLIASIECVPHLWHRDSLFGPAAHIFLFQQRQLQIK